LVGEVSKMSDVETKRLLNEEREKSNTIMEGYLNYIKS
jgi:hypothetical protein